MKLWTSPWQDKTISDPLATKAIKTEKKKRKIEVTYDIKDSIDSFHGTQDNITCDIIFFDISYNRSNATCISLENWSG